MSRVNEARRRARRHALIVAHIPLVEKIARSVQWIFGGRLPVDDLIQSGCIGLLEAAGRWDSKQGVIFSAFAYRRIRGAIIDANKRQSYFEEQCHESLDAWLDTLETDGSGGWAEGATKLEEALHDRSPQPDEQYLETERRDVLARRIERLPDAERDALSAALHGQPLALIARARGVKSADARYILENAQRLVGL